MKAIDIFGRNFYFSFDQSEKYKTNFGAALTVIMFMSFIPLFFVFGSDIYQKNIPQVITSSKVNYYNRTKIDFKSSFAIGMYSYAFGTNYSKYFNITSNFKSSISNSYFKSEIKASKTAFYPCEKQNFKNTVDKFDFLSLNLSKCLNETYPLEGYSNTPKQTWVKFEINECKNGTDIICASKIEIESTYDFSLFFYVLYEDYEFTPQNYTFPIKYFLNQRFTPSLNNKFLKKYQIYFEDVTIETDSGIFGNEITQLKLQKLDYMVEDINNVQKYTNNLAEIYLFPSENSFLIQRTYIKLQNIFAQVFTVLNLFFIIFGIFTNNIYESKMKEIFYKKVYEGFEDEDKGKQINVKLLKPNTNKLTQLSNISNSNIQINQNNNLNLIKDVNINNNMNINNNNTNINFSHVNNAANDIVSNNDVISISKFKTNRRSLNGNAKNDLNYPNFKDLDITFCEYFAFLFCSCFQCNFNEKYGNLIKNIHFCIQKNDVIYITKKLIEIEKIKEILFDKDQLAEFNSIDNIMFLESDCENHDKIKKLSSNFKGTNRIRLI